MMDVPQAGQAGQPPTGWQPRRILLINKYWRFAGGVENHAFEVKAALESLGHAVVPFAMRETDTLDTEEIERFPPEVDFRSSRGREGLRSLARASFSTGAKRPLRELLRSERFDAAYVLHIYHQLGMPLINLLRKEGVPTVLSLHDYKMICPNYRLYSERTGSMCTRCFDRPSAALWAPVAEGCWNGSRTAGAALVIEALAERAQHCYQHADVVTTLNSLQEEGLRRRGVHRNVVRVPHPVKLKPPRPSVRRDHFVFVGRLVPEKGLDRLIPAVASAGVPLRIIGDGRSRADLEQLAITTGADVEFIGSREPAEVRQELRDAIALVVPSTWHEVSPLVVYEAISEDTPVIGSSVGGMTDQLADGRGYLVDPEAGQDVWAATLRSVMDDQGAAAERSAAARSYMEAHQSPEQWLESLCAAFALAGVRLQ